MISLVRAGSVAGWDNLIAAVEEALRLGVTDGAAVLHILRMPDPQQRRELCVSSSAKARGQPDRVVVLVSSRRSRPSLTALCRNGAQCARARRVLARRSVPLRASTVLASDFSCDGWPGGMTPSCW